MRKYEHKNDNQCSWTTQGPAPRCDRPGGQGGSTLQR